MLPVFSMMKNCRTSCGADSRKASSSPDPRASCLIIRIRFAFWCKLVSISIKAKKSLKFLEKVLVCN